MGAFEGGADTGKGHALSFSLHPRALTSKQRLIKKKSKRTFCRSYSFVFLLHVPLRLEAMIKILTVAFWLLTSLFCFFLFWLVLVLFVATLMVAPWPSIAGSESVFFG